MKTHQGPTPRLFAVVGICNRSHVIPLASDPLEFLEVGNSLRELLMMGCLVMSGGLTGIVRVDWGRCILCSGIRRLGQSRSGSRRVD
jgi:hypothetical protein